MKKRPSGSATSGRVRSAAPPREEPAPEIRDDGPDHLKGLDALGVPELNQVIREATRLKEAKLDAARSEFMSRVKTESEQLGFDLGTLFSGPEPTGRGKKPGSGTGSRAAVSAKYRGPGGEEWSGRGRPPKWVQVAEAEGKSRDDFLLDESTE